MNCKTWPNWHRHSLALVVDSCLCVFGFFIENSRGVDILRPQRKKDPDIAEDGALGQGDAFFQLKKASFRILFLRYELRLILFFTGEREGWPRPPCIQSEAVFPKLRLTEITILVSESSGGVQNSGLDWWYLLIPSFGSHSSVVGVRRERAQSAWAHCFHSAVDLAKARAQLWMIRLCKWFLQMQRNASCLGRASSRPSGSWLHVPHVPGKSESELIWCLHVLCFFRRLLIQSYFPHKLHRKRID